MKTKVKITTSDEINSSYKENEVGYIDGYLFIDDVYRYYAVVIIQNNIKVVPIKYLTVI